MCVEINLSKFYLNYLIYFTAFLSELRIFIIVNRNHHHRWRIFAKINTFWNTMENEIWSFAVTNG